MSAADKIVSLDLETTGLRPDLHEVWEIGIVPFDVSRPALHYQFHVGDLPQAEPGALAVGRFYDRYTWPSRYLDGMGNEYDFAHDMLTPSVIGEDEPLEYTLEPAFVVARKIAEALDGATLLGCAVHFDANFLRPWLESENQAAAWHHRYLDLGSFAAGAWGGVKPLSSKALSDRVPNADAHNAYADAKWNMEVYRSITGSQVM